MALCMRHAAFGGKGVLSGFSRDAIPARVRA